MSDDTSVHIESDQWVVIIRQSISALAIVGVFDSEDEVWEWVHDQFVRLRARRQQPVTAYMVAKVNGIDPDTPLEFSFGWRTEDGYLA